MRQGNAAVHCYAFDWHKRQYVGCPDTRVGSVMFIEIDQFSRLAYYTQCCFRDGLRLASKGNHGPIVVGVAVNMEDPCAGNTACGGHERFNSRRIAAFGKIGNAFDKLLHANVECCACSKYT
jgi:hypothetical protein